MSEERDRSRQRRSGQNMRPSFHATPKINSQDVADDPDRILLPGEKKRFLEQELEQSQQIPSTEYIRPSIPEDTVYQEESGENTAKLQQFIGRTWMPIQFFKNLLLKIFKMLVPNSIQQAVQDRINQLPESAKYRFMLVKTIFKWIFLAFVTFAALVWFVSVIGGVTISEPQTAKELFERVPKTERVFYTTEIVRTKQIDGAELRQDQVLKLGVDLARNVFQFEAEGIEDDVIRLIGNGKTAIYTKGNNTTPGEINKYPSADSLRPLLAQDLIPIAGQLITNEATVQGEQGWLATWKPTRETILRMLNADLIQASGDDIDSIRKGDFIVEYATATVYRKSKRIYQIMAIITVNDATIQILSTYRDYNAEALKDLHFDQETQS